MLIQDIEDTNQLEETLLKRLESLLREDGKNFERISDARIGYENYSMLHCAAKANRPNLCAFFIDEINIGSTFDFFFMCFILFYLNKINSVKMLIF